MGMMCEYDVYVPLVYNNGLWIEGSKLASLRGKIIERFNGLTTLATSLGYWMWEGELHVDHIAIYRVIAEDTQQNWQFFLELRPYLKKELKQEEVLITCRKIQMVEPRDGESKVSRSSVNPGDHYNNDN